MAEAPLGPHHAPQLADAQRRFWLIVDAMIAALVVVVLVGLWAYFQVRGSLRDLRTTGLTTFLESQSHVIELWIDEKRRDAERWAATPAVRRAAGALVRAGEPALACRDATQAPFRGEIAPFMAVEELTAFNLMARDGRIVSATRGDNCGREVSTAFRQRLAPVFEGRTLFVPPLADAERVAGAAAEHAEALAWVEAPVRGADGSVVAALGFGRRAADRFARLLAADVAGTSREAYAFDEQGRMLTDSRFAKAPGAVRDGAGSLTPLAAAALEHRDSLQGVLAEPYRNYRGALVIGAWRWLPEARMAVAAEVEAAEAYAPLGYLQEAFAGLFALVLVSMTAAASTSLWAVRAGLREARRVGPYRIEREIGEGGMSNIYLATHAYLRRSAAVKVLKPHLATDEVVARFRREAQLCSQLEHPNTVEVYDYGNTRDGRWYYAMEYLQGLSIHDLVHEHGPMPVARVVHALRGACGSLEEAHERGWVHRDVKPGNIMLCLRGGHHDVVKVLDFGLIKQLGNPDTRDITQYAKVLGTPLFMAPERIRNPSDADARADIYALAAVAFYALTGRNAFEARTDHDIVYRVMNEPAPALSQAGAADVPGALEALVMRCLEKDRERRPARVDEVRTVLEAVAATHPWTEADARAWWDARAPRAGAAV